MASGMCPDGKGGTCTCKCNENLMGMGSCKRGEHCREHSKGCHTGEA